MKVKIQWIFDLYSKYCIVIDHGTANVELIINEAFQDLPALVFDVQERLRRKSYLLMSCVKTF